MTPTSAQRRVYNAYIASPAWTAKREAFLAQAPCTKCHWCARPWSRGFHVHHVTYERLGAELFSDLRPMCEPCHDALHKIHKRLGPECCLLELTDRYAFGKKHKAMPDELRIIWLQHALRGRKQELRLAKLRKIKALRNGF